MEGVVDKFSGVKCEPVEEEGVLYEVCKDEKGRVVRKQKLLTL